MVQREDTAWQYAEWLAHAVCVPKNGFGRLVWVQPHQHRAVLDNLHIWIPHIGLLSTSKLLARYAAMMALAPVHAAMTALISHTASGGVVRHAVAEYSVVPFAYMSMFSSSRVRAYCMESTPVPGWETARL